MGGTGFLVGNKKPFFVVLQLLLYAWSSLAFSGIDVVAVLSPKTDQQVFEDAMEGLSQGLEGECELVKMTIERETSLRELKSFFDATRPNLIVLMDNKAVTLYRSFQNAYQDQKPFAPSVILMTLYADKLVDTIENAMTVEYQIPAVMSLVYFRSLLKNNMKKAGVLYRRETAYFFEKQKLGCAREGIELVGVMVDEFHNKIKPRRVRAGLNQLIHKDKIDVLLILDDNSLLSRNLLQKAWIPILHAQDLPTIVGNEHFVSEQDLIGNFAVIPDSFALGDQTAQIILDIKERNWSLEGNPIREPVSVRKLLNIGKLPEYLLNRASLEEVDRVIED